MAVGKVTVTQEDNNGGGITEVERKVLWLGEADAQYAEQLYTINAQTNLDDLLGELESDLKTNIAASMLNAGPNFTAYVFPIMEGGEGLYTWDEALLKLIDEPYDLDFEMVALTMPPYTPEHVEFYQAVCDNVLSFAQKYITIHVALPGLEEFGEAAESWEDFGFRVKQFQNEIVAERVHLVPQIDGNNLGVVVGRLVNDKYSIADSPMRVASGAVKSLGFVPGGEFYARPEDRNGEVLSSALIEELSNNRFSVPQKYAGLNGTYWADHMSLAEVGSDFQVYENLRVLDYLTRRVRLLAIQKIANREFNSTASSTAAHEGYFMKPILDASKDTVLKDRTIPGICQKPVDGDIVITWVSTTQVQIYMLAAPVNSPKKIGVNIGLDLNRLG